MIISNPVMARAKKLMVMIQCELFTQRLCDKSFDGSAVMSTGAMSCC